MWLKLKNETTFLSLCALMGGFVGVILWAFLKAMGVGIEFIWETIPRQFSIPYYTIIVCTVGGLIIGLFRKKYGDLPEELDVVLGKVSETHHYEYKNMLVMLFAALMPLLLGSSIGPEAGLTGVIVGLCYWLGDNIKFAKKSSEDFSKIGVAATLGVLFHAPLFGLFEVAEETGDDGNITLAKNTKIVSYGVCIAAGMGMYSLLSHFLGGGMGMPSLVITGELQWNDYAMLFVYIVVGIAMAWFYEMTHHFTHKIMEKVPDIVRETLGGLSLGVIGLLVPVVMFSGEESMAELIEIFGIYAPIGWIGVALLKVLLTNLCIQSGLKGGHFFPLIFAAVSMGFGVSAMVMTGADHQVFAGAIITATMLGCSMKKPLAVSMLLLMCFPAKLIVWYFLAAAVGSKIKFDKVK